MSPTTNIVILGIAVLAGCGGGSGGTAAPGPDAAVDAVPPCVPPVPGTAPTYTQLYTRYFAANTEGHCATAGCHADPDHQIWLCGSNKDTCFNGMVSALLIDQTNPTLSVIGDKRSSPLRWINPSGNMPFDTPGPFPEGRDAILAWVAACAQNN